MTLKVQNAILLDLLSDLPDSRTRRYQDQVERDKKRRRDLGLQMSWGFVSDTLLVGGQGGGRATAKAGWRCRRKGQLRQAMSTRPPALVFLPEQQLLWGESVRYIVVQ